MIEGSTATEAKDKVRRTLELGDFDVPNPERTWQRRFLRQGARTGICTQSNDGPMGTAVARGAGRSHQLMAALQR